MDLNLLLDGLIVVLLVATIAYATVLNRRLGALRNAKAEMEAVIARFVESTQSAGSGLEALKAHTERSGQVLQDTSERARGLTDELAYLIEKGNVLAKRLDGALGAARSGNASRGAPEKSRDVRNRSEAGPIKAVRDSAKPRGSGGAHASDAGVPDLPAAEAKILEALRGMR